MTGRRCSTVAARALLWMLTALLYGSIVGVLTFGAAPVIQSLILVACAHVLRLLPAAPSVPTSAALYASFEHAR